jgi:adenylylsulfate kinase
MSTHTITRTGATVWLTGLSGAGKTTIANTLADDLRSAGHRVEVLDGDELRRNLSAGLGFSRADRDVHVRRVGYVANLLARNGVLVLVPVIAPYADSRAAVRQAHQESGTSYVEVYVSTPIDECVRRDVKGLYAAGTDSMTGVDDPYEAPVAPDIAIDTTGQTITESAGSIRNLLQDKGLL